MGVSDVFCFVLVCFGCSPHDSNLLCAPVDTHTHHTTDSQKVIMPKGGRRRRDPNKPKRGKSAFLLFSQYTRPAVLEEHPSMSFAELAKEVRSNHMPKRKFDLDCTLSPHFLPRLVLPATGCTSLEDH